MVARLRDKPGGDQLVVTIGDFAAVDVPGRYRLVDVVFNTFHDLLTQDDQVRCFENVAAQLPDDGVFGCSSPGAGGRSSWSRTLTMRDETRSSAASKWLNGCSS
jgi:hypothetical protein